MSGLHEGRTILVTGATGFLGRAICEALLGEGAQLVAVGNSNKPDIAYKESFQIDATMEEQVCILFDTIEKKGLELHGAVFCHGVGLSKLSLVSSGEDWRAGLETNLMSHALCSREAAKRMLEHQCGSILFLSSLAARRPIKGQAVYAAAKAGLEGLTRAMAVELGTKGIRVNALSPGFVEGGLTVAMTEAMKATILDSIPLKRWARAGEIAQTASFLLGPGAGYITGQVIDVSGGLGV